MACLQRGHKFLPPLIFSVLEVLKKHQSPAIKMPTGVVSASETIYAPLITPSCAFSAVSASVANFVFLTQASLADFFVTQQFSKLLLSYFASAGRNTVRLGIARKAAKCSTG